MPNGVSSSWRNIAAALTFSDILSNLLPATAVSVWKHLAGFAMSHPTSHPTS